MSATNRLKTKYKEEVISKLMEKFDYKTVIKEQIIFPEINLDKISRITGMDISFVTTANTDAEALELLKLLGMPFKNQRN